MKLQEDLISMENIAELLSYFKKLQKAIDNADVNLLKFRLLKKSRIDDLLVCTLSLLPDSFKKAMKKRLKLDVYPSVSCYNRLSKVIKKPFILSSDYYIIKYDEVYVLLKSIIKDIESDIKKLEEE